LYIGGDTEILSTTISNNTETGALIVAGGVGIGGDVNIGSNLYVTGILESLSGTMGSITLNSTVNSTSTNTGTLKVGGGAGIGKNLYVGGDVKILSSVGASSTTTGALQIIGGVGIGGGIYVADTSAFTGTVTVPTQSYNDNSTKVASTAYVDTALSIQNTVLMTPSGFENTTDSVITYNSSTRILTITPSGTSFNVWTTGIRHTFSASLSSTAHSDTAGTVVFYYIDSSGILQMSASYPTMYNIALVAFIYYYSSTIYLVAEERHGTVMDPATRNELHQTIGTYFVSGLVVANYTLIPASPTNTDNTYSISSGVISDEQLLLSITELSVGGPYTVLQLIGSGVWTWTVDNTLPFYYEIDSYIQYNQYTGGSWQLTTLLQGSYVNYYIIFTGSLSASTQILIIPGQITYSTLAAAQGENFYNLDHDGLVFPEFLPLYKITYRTGSSYTNTGKCRIEAFTRIVGSSVSITNNIATNHQSLAELHLTGTGITYGHISDQTQTIEGIKIFGNTSNSTSITTGSVIINGGLGITKDIYGGQHLILSSTETSSSITTGVLQVAGGAGIGSLYVAGSSTLNSSAVLNGNLTMGTNDIVSVGKITSSEEIITTLTTGSSSTTTGSLLISGGAGNSREFIYRWRYKH
jgi:hypothetical protein